MAHPDLPPRQGLYDPDFEHDSCGVGFVVDIKGRQSHAIVKDALQVLKNLLHRGACGCEVNTGDGAGILMQVPHDFFVKETAKLGFTLPERERYAVGMVFLPTDAAERAACERIFEEQVVRSGQRVLGWRDVPQDNSPIGASAKRPEPAMRQLFIGRSPDLADVMAFERRLYLIRRRTENAVLATDLAQKHMFYVSSLSARTIVYKGMLSADQIETYFADLNDESVASALALVHQRFSTNTFPTWSLAHPFRYLAHNGEINTLRGNINWMHARQGLFESDLLGDEIKDLLPIIQEGGSDSATFDNALELLVMAGRSLPHAMMMLIPEAWSGHESMSDEKKAFYDFHSSLMEPWDGPASMAFTDGAVIGAVLDRNGLRPSRYYVTKDGLVIMASEVGVMDVPPENILYKGRLQPGKMFLIDTAEGRIVDDYELKHRIATEHPYREWLDTYRVKIEELPAPRVGADLVSALPVPDHDTILHRQMTFGFTHEELKILMAPMVANGEEAIGSMGNDAALAVLSERPQLLYNYFKQLFAQVTNPPLDAIREEIVTSIGSTVGPERNLLRAEPRSCEQIELHSAIIDNEELAKLRALGARSESMRVREFESDGAEPPSHPHTLTPSHPGTPFHSRTLPMLFPAKAGAEGLDRALRELCEAASQAIAEGVNILILSDRGVDQNNAPIPSLLATAGVHHHLVRRGTRTKVGLVVESGDAREVHHYCLLIGYGAGAVNPWLAFETVDDMLDQGLLPAQIDHKKALKNYIKAVNKGVLKVISKMGISTLASYCGAQIFEAVGLDQEFVDKYFTWTSSRVGGVGLDVIAEEVLIRHGRAYPERPVSKAELEWGGQYQWRHDGEYHLFNPQTVFKLQHSTRANSYKIFKEYSSAVDDQSMRLATLRGLLELQFNNEPVPIEEVEPVESIMRRFKTGAMSFGSISKEAHETLAIAMNRIGGKSNTGEGGEDRARYVKDANGDWRRSAIKQVASARFGVTSEYLVNADELQIKMAQGAKPGEGGQLPGHKVDKNIAKVRHSTPGVGLISPPPHHDIYSIEDLAQLIHDLKNSNPRARVSVKLVAEVGVGTVAAGVSKAHADVVLISGHDGGTGASPLTSIKHAGIPWELGLAETHQVLVMNDLRSRIVIETDGQLKTGRDVVIAALLGAEEFGFATAPLVVSGCIMMRVCHLNTCPVGVATQDPELRKKFTGKPEFVVNFFRFIAEEVRELMAKLGFRTVDEMIGRVDKLNARQAVDHWKARGLDFSNILYQPPVREGVITRCVVPQDHGLDKALDNELIALARPALDWIEGAGSRVLGDGDSLPPAPTTRYSIPRVEHTVQIRNVNRTVGTMLGYELTRRYGGPGLPDDTIRFNLKGSAGQSFGAFVPKGITLTLEGDANDYTGKGLSGGKLIVYPPKASTFVPHENILIGNVALYGATSGEAYFYGVAGERFAVRNSGAHTVVESVGDHGCEYMTGGRVVVLGPTGRNFAAGMSGGLAYVLDETEDFHVRCNQEMVDLERIETDEDDELVRDLIERHARYTGSERAEMILANWSDYRSKFVKIFPRDYKRVLREAEVELAAVTA